MTDQCPQHWAVCRKHNKKGHVAKVCHSGANDAGSEDMDIDIQEDTAGLVPDNTTNKLLIEVSILLHRLHLQVDMGTAVSLLNVHMYSDLRSPSLAPVHRCIHGYGKQCIPLLGQFTINVTYKSVTCPLTFIVVCDASSASRFGLDAFQLFGFAISDSIQLVSEDVPYHSLESLTSEFRDVFEEGIGCVYNFQISLALRSQIKAELDQLTALGVVLPMFSCEWAMPLL